MGTSQDFVSDPSPVLPSRPFSKDPGVSPKPLFGDPTTPLLKERARLLYRHLPRTLAGEEEAVHQMRVAGRRLRVALPLLACKPGGRRVRRAVKRLRELVGAAGGSRDLDVGLALFEERLRSLPEANPEGRLLRRRLRAARARSRARMAEALLDLDIARLRRDLRAVVSRGGEGLFTVLVRLKGQREEQGARLLAAFAALGDRFATEELHRLRIRARRLRYAAELADGLREQDSGAPALFKELQDQLGRIHDEQLLADWLERQAKAAERRGQQALAAEARDQQSHFGEAARQHHRSLVERGPADLVRAALEALGGARNAA